MPGAFVGRVAELRALRDALVLAERRRASAVVLVTGAPGIGKTRLLAEFATREKARARVLMGRGSPLGTAIPFSLVVEALETRLRSMAPAAVAALAGAYGGPLARVVPSAAALADESPMGPLRTLEAFVHVLAGLAADRPLLLLLDDVHEADPSTVELVGYVGRNAIAAPVLVVAALREEEFASTDGAATLRALAKDGLASLVHLGVLARDEVAALARDRAAGDAARIERVYQLARGNPLFSVALLAEESATGRAPRTVQEHLHERVRKLDESSREALAAAAVLGHPFTLMAFGPIVGAAATLSLDTLVRHELLSVTDDLAPRYDFVHPVIREAVYDTLGAASRRELHARIARASVDATPAFRAYHAVRGALPGDDDLLALVRDGARAAEEAQEHREAVTLLERAVAIAPSEGERLEILDELAWQASEIGDHRTGVPALRELAKARAGDPLAAANARMRLASLLASGSGDLAAATVEARAALELFTRARAADRVASATNELAWIQGQAGDVRAQIAGSTRALEEAESRGERVSALHALGSLAHALGLEGRWLEALAAGQRGIALARELGERAHLQWHTATLAETLAGSGDLSGGLRAIADLLAQGDAEVDLPYSRRSFIRWWSGDWDGALADCRATIALHRDDVAVHSAWVLSIAAAVEAAAGHAEAARGFISRADRAYAGGAHYWFSGRHAWGTALAQWMLGDLVDARHRIERCVAQLTALGAPLPLIQVLPDAAALRAAAGDRDGARELARVASTLADRLNTHMAHALAAFAVAAASDDTEAEAHLDAAIRACHDVGLPFLQARAVHALAARARDDRRAALLTEAARLYATLPAPTLVEETRASLRDEGSSGRRAAQHVGALTEREREIVLLARSGLRTRDIAAKLQIGERTVETHLAHAYAKLGVRDRTELAGREI